MITPFPLVTVDSSGRSRSFEVSAEPDDQESEKLYVTVLEVGAGPVQMGGFQMTLVPHGMSDHRIDAIAAEPSHRKVGIPEALLPALVQKLGGRVVSSSSRHPTTDTEFRSVEAEHMWRRLVSKGIARFDQQQDRYFCP